jgi:hypothetical protein
MIQQRDCANAIELAMAAYAAGELDIARSVFAKNADALEAHRGRGALLSYFAPALYFSELCDLLIEAGFPVTPILTDLHDGSVGWMSWPSACEAVARAKPNFLANHLRYGFHSENFEPMPWTDHSGRNRDISLDYFPGGLVAPFEAALEHYLESSGNDWCDRLATAAAALSNFASNALPRRSECDEAFEQMRELGASEAALAKLEAALTPAVPSLPGRAQQPKL